MPFDSATSGNAQLLADLDLIAHRLRSPNGWCRGTQVNKTGNRVCLHGAVNLVKTAERRIDLRRTLNRAAIARGYGTAVEFNDNNSVRHRDILGLIEEAKVIAIQESQYAF